MKPAPHCLQELLDERDLIFVTGKGGTGKSTMVATLAELAAVRRGRAMAVEVSANPLLSAMVNPSARIQLRNIDAEEVVGPALARLLNLPAMAASVLNNRMLRMFIRTSPSVREMILLDELGHLVAECAKDQCPVIVDLHATGHALALLDTPRAVRELLRVGPLFHVAKRAEELLTNPSRTELVAVALPEELPINETIELVRRAEQVGVRCRSILVNQVPAAPVEQADRGMLDSLREGGGGLGRFAEIAQEECALADLARGHLDRLRSSVQAEVVELPRCVEADPRNVVTRLVEALRP